MIIDVSVGEFPEDAPRAAQAPMRRTERIERQPLALWLDMHRQSMFRWAMALAGMPPLNTDLAARRVFAETAVAVQRSEGEQRVLSWLYGECLLAAQRHAVQGALSEALLAGLPPELRALLRLVARGALSADEAWALLPQRMDEVRRRLVQARLALPTRTAH